MPVSAVCLALLAASPAVGAGLLAADADLRASVAQKRGPYFIVYGPRIVQTYWLTNTLEQVSAFPAEPNESQASKTK